MRSDLEIGYLGIEVPDPNSLTAFLGDVIGLGPGGTLDGDMHAWRNDDKAYRILVAPGPANDAVFVGWEAVNAAAFERVLGRLGAAGCEVTAGTDQEQQARRVQQLARTTAPWGVSIEVVLGLEQTVTPFASPLMPGGFLTSGVGFGHVVFATTHYEESHQFLTEGLGLAQSDWLEMEITEDFQLEVHFYHSNERHHSIALAKLPFEPPQRLHHLMVETIDRDDVGAAFDRAWATDLSIPHGLGRHDNDGMFSFYVASPAGFQVEVGHGAKLVDDVWAGNHRYARISRWGHQPLRYEASLDV